MKEKKSIKGLVFKISILIIFVIGFITYVVYDEFLKDDKINEVSQIVYVCGSSSRNKHYSYEFEDDTCQELDFNCINCEIINDYIEDRILYKSKNSVVLYDLKTQKQLDKITISKEKKYEDFYVLGDNYKINGFTFYNENNKFSFYNINNNKKFIVDGTICDFSYNGMSKNVNCEYSNLKDYSNLIIKDFLLIRKNDKYGILNVNTGNYSIEPNKTFIEYDYIESTTDSYNGYFKIPKDNEDGIILYDDKLNIIFDNSLNETKTYDNDFIRYLGKDIILVYVNKEYLSLIDTKVNEYPNSKIYVSDINKNLSKLYSSDTIKNYYNNDINTIFDKEIENIYTYYNDVSKTVTISFPGDYYYEYDFNTKQYKHGEISGYTGPME